MGAPAGAYPIGKYTAADEQAKNPLPPFVCQACGGSGDGYTLLGVDDVDTMWCPNCGSTHWHWGIGGHELATIRAASTKVYTPSGVQVGQIVKLPGLSPNLPWAAVLPCGWVAAVPHPDEYGAYRLRFYDGTTDRAMRVKRPVQPDRLRERLVRLLEQIGPQAATDVDELFWYMTENPFDL
jgi:hypothetical protein